MAVAWDYFQARLTLSDIYVRESMYKEAAAEAQKVLASVPGKATALSRLGYAYAVGGMKAEAQKVPDQLHEIAGQRYVPPVQVAGIYAGLLDKEWALEWLEKSFAERSLGLGDVGIKVNPAFDPMRSDPRFQDLLSRMNCSPSWRRRNFRLQLVRLLELRELFSSEDSLTNNRALISGQIERIRRSHRAVARRVQVLLSS